MVVAAAVPAVALPMMITLAALPLPMLIVWTPLPFMRLSVWLVVAGPIVIVRASADVPRFKPPVPAWIVVTEAPPAVALPMMMVCTALPVAMLVARASADVPRFKPPVPAWMVVAAAVAAVALPITM